MASDPLAEMDATAQADLVRRGEASARELVDAEPARSFLRARVDPKVATGLALTLFGIGLSAFVGYSYAGRPVLVNVWLEKTEFREGSISM